MKKDSIGNRMKDYYENRYRIKLTRRTPVVLRLDGKAFHTLTRNADKPFDNRIIDAMQKTTISLCEEIQGCKFAYTQSDEISILITDYDKLTTDAWFDYNLQKIVSVSASIASVHFSNNYGKIGYFDCRAFNVPREDVCNYFIWRQQDWTRNSIQMVAQSLYSHSELQNKNSSDLHEMLFKKGFNWAKMDGVYKNGSSFDKDASFLPDGNVIFVKDRNIIEKHLKENE